MGLSPGQNKTNHAIALESARGARAEGAWAPRVTLQRFSPATIRAKASAPLRKRVW